MDGTPQAENQLSIVTHPYHVSPEVIVNWASDRLEDDELGGVHELGNFQAFGVMRGMEPIAAVIYNNYHPMKYGGDCRVIVVSDDPNWCRPGILRELFEYPFIHLNCARVTAVIRDGNEKSFKLCQGLGFKREGTLRRGHNGRTNAVVLSMLKHECKWLDYSPPQQEQKNGQEGRWVVDAGTPRSDEDDRGADGGEQGRNRRKRKGQQLQPVRSNGERDLRP